MSHENSSSDEERWQAAQTFDELCELAAQFIEGRMNCFPGYGGEAPDPETNEIAVPLAAFNRAGFLTDCSQPGIPGDEFRQRAFVTGFASEGIARRLAALCLESDLIVFVYEPASTGGGYQVPVTVDDFHPSTWVGMCAHQEELEFYEEALSEAAFAELLRTCYVAIIDPQWGRKEYLWETVLRSIAGSIEARYSPDPAPHLDIGMDFLGRPLG